MNDEDFILRLRSASRHTPDVVVDHAEVLRSGRRRRAGRAVGSTLGVGALCGGLVAGALALTPPPTRETPVMPATTSPTAQAPSEPGGGPRAIVDEAAGTITTPLDDWVLGADELTELRTANHVLTARCMTDAGYGHTVVSDGPSYPLNTDGFGFGLWRHDALLRSGYEMDLEGVSRNGFTAAPGTEEAVTAQLDVCGQQAVEAGLTYDPEELGEIPPTGSILAADTPEGVTVVAAWKQCLADRGVEPPGQDDGMVPPAAQDASPDEVVRIGEIDLACKRDLDTVQQLADIQAAHEAEYVAQHKDYLERRLTLERAALEASRAYLEEQGVSMDPATW
ncbi:hypothetical protein [Cellulosimicrobium sp. NPDC057862]|uniref:hypothetical protein n=1 Tax=Cellulosimicrobium sp. NPDC057862 TaxID=3346266 RepID=UPI00366F3F54